MPDDAAAEALAVLFLAEPEPLVFITLRVGPVLPMEVLGVTQQVVLDLTVVLGIQRVVATAVVMLVRKVLAG